LTADPSGRWRRNLVGEQTEELAQHQVFRVHGHVGLEVALPPTVTVLKGQQVFGGALGGAASTGEECAGLALDGGHRSLLVTKSAVARRASITATGASGRPSRQVCAMRMCRSASVSAHFRPPASWINAAIL